MTEVQKTTVSQTTVTQTPKIEGEKQTDKMKEDEKRAEAGTILQTGLPTTPTRAFAPPSEDDLKKMTPEQREAAKSGPNPTPNRIGNEITHMENSLRSLGVLDLNALKGLLVSISTVQVKTESEADRKKRTDEDRETAKRILALLG